MSTWNLGIVDCSISDVKPFLHNEPLWRGKDSTWTVPIKQELSFWFLGWWMWAWLQMCTWILPMTDCSFRSLSDVSFLMTLMCLGAERDFLLMWCTDGLEHRRPPQSPTLRGNIPLTWTFLCSDFRQIIARNPMCGFHLCNRRSVRTPSAKSHNIHSLVKKKREEKWVKRSMTTSCSFHSG